MDKQVALSKAEMEAEDALRKEKLAAEKEKLSAKKA